MKINTGTISRTATGRGTKSCTINHRKVRTNESTKWFIVAARSTATIHSAFESIASTFFFKTFFFVYVFDLFCLMLKIAFAG